nr:MAG TPA: hypothetical protein [Caudoviricetes sp.]
MAAHPGGGRRRPALLRAGLSLSEHRPRSDHATGRPVL